MNYNLSDDERIITGNFINKDNKIIEDNNCKRIRNLTTNYLNLLTTDRSGWMRLYRDPETGNYWELTYPNSEMHGGGPPELRRIDNLEHIKENYELK